MVGPVAFTPDGKQVISCGSSPSRLPWQNDVKLWDSTTGHPLRFQHSGLVDNLENAALNLDGTQVAAIRGHQTVFVWDLATGGLVTLQGPAGQMVLSGSFSPDSRRLVCMYRPDEPKLMRSICVWNLNTRQAGLTIDRHSFSVPALPALNPGGKYLIVGPWQSGDVRVLDTETGQEVLYCKYSAGRAVAAASIQPGR